MIFGTGNYHAKRYEEEKKRKEIKKSISLFF
jgi:hypothetical protein